MHIEMKKVAKTQDRHRMLSVQARFLVSALAAFTCFAAAPLVSAIAQEALAPVAAPAPVPAQPSEQTFWTGASPSIIANSGTQAAGATTDAQPPTFDAVELPRDLSPWGMFIHADIVVKSVMISLVFASIVTWTVWLAKSLELFSANRRLRTALAMISSEQSLAGAYQQLGRNPGVIPTLIEAAAAELQISKKLVDKDGLKERIASRLSRIEATAGRQMVRGTGALATIGATAPFVGLFGAVWGIMNSFIGISTTQVMSLAVVAPGIAEALLATAIGLAAAIPAVIIYNQFARSVAGYKALVADAAAEVTRLVSRDLDRSMHLEILRTAE